jgi:hypothetical protein
MSNPAKVPAGPSSKPRDAEKRAFTTAEAAIFLGRSVSWLQKRRLAGRDDAGDRGPRFLKTPTGTTLYLREYLDEYIEELERQFESAGACR